MTTSNVELLPLPETPMAGQFAKDVPVYDAGQVRAIVANATAAKDAEIEALRAEVARRDGIDPWAVLIRAQQAEARAERLAEALRLAMDWNWLDDDARPSGTADVCDAALHPTAAQEAGND